MLLGCIVHIGFSKPKKAQVGSTLLAVKLTLEVVKHASPRVRLQQSATKRHKTSQNVTKHHETSQSVTNCYLVSNILYLLRLHPYSDNLITFCLQVDNLAAEQIVEAEAVDESLTEESDQLALDALNQNSLNAQNNVNQQNQQQLQAVNQEGVIVG